jgi:putative transposase
MRKSVKRTTEYRRIWGFSKTQRSHLPHSTLDQSAMLRAAEGRESLMSHAYVSNLMHCTFSTKDRFPFIDSELEPRLWSYLGGIAREKRMKELAIGGTMDHLHALLSLTGMMSFAKAVQLIKGGSSKWVHDTFPGLQRFAWQEGYGAFSVSASQVPKTIAYIKNRKEHHQKKTFMKELLELLQRHGIEYDPRFVS